MSQFIEPYVKPVEMLFPDGAMAIGKFLIWDNDNDNPKLARVTLQFLERQLSSRNASFQIALRDIRGQLERDGILIRCYGCSRNVWASSMSGSMGRGVRAYKCFLGKKGDRRDLISIFDSGPDVDPCTLKDQEEFHKRWLASIANPSERRH